MISALMRKGLRPRLLMEELTRMGISYNYATVQNYCSDARFFFPDLPIFRGGRLSGKNYHLPSMQPMCKRNYINSKNGPAES